MTQSTSAPLVSVLIPTYNRETLLMECLNHLAAQTFRDFEVCLVNDGGNPLAKLVAGFPQLNLQLYEFQLNGGHVRCRNQALALARGEFIAFCDDDDLFLPNHLQTLVTACAAADFVYSGVEILAVDENGAVSEKLHFAFPFDAGLLRRTNFIAPSAILYRKSLHQKLGSFDTETGTYWDWDWFLRVSQIARIRQVPETTVYYHFEKSGRNMSANPESHRNSLEYLCGKHNLGKLPVTNFYLMAKHGLTENVRRT